MFDDPIKLILGFISGIFFGFLLQKGQVAKFQKILGQLLLKDHTVVKIMATAVAVGTVGVYATVETGAATLHIQPATLGRIVMGGILFGSGLAIFGLCPGTSVAACGEGRKDAMVGVLGMLAGAAAYVAGFALLEPLMNSLPDLGKRTLPELTHSSVWIWSGALAAAVAVFLLILERRHPRRLDQTP